jgi:hypothetical protein
MEGVVATEIWTQLTITEVQAAMPTELGPLYASWIVAHPEKDGRLDELTAEAVDLCRAAVAAGSVNALDADETKVPVSGYRHMLNMIFFNLGMEMGIDFEPEVHRVMTRADVWLRGVQLGSINVAGEESTVPSPSYKVGTRSSRWIIA